MPTLDAHLFFRLFSVSLLAWQGIRAWKRGDRAGVIDPALLGVSFAALLIPEAYPGFRYGIAGAALAIVIARSVKRDLIDGSDTDARWMTIGLLVFVASIMPAMFMSSPRPEWTKYLALCGIVVMLVTLLRPFVWMTRVLFSAHRLHRDLKHSRPPREADEKVLGIDLSVLREPRGPASAR